MKSILSNKNNSKVRKNGKLLSKLFKRYSKVEDFHRSICSFFSKSNLPEIPPKKMLQRTEVIERRQINFELFLQTIMLHSKFLSYDKTQEFFKFNYNYEKEEKKEILKVYF